LPFIARYRKEMTGGLDEEQIRAVAAALETLRALDDRRATILNSLEENGHREPELLARIKAATTRTELEDLYQPYRPKRRTRATVARELGLEPLAKKILQQELVRGVADEQAAPFVSADVPTADDALAGARDIVAETISDHPAVRQLTREKAQQWSTLQVERIDDSEDPKAVFRLYYDFSLRIDRLRPHQILAINRGEAQKILRVKLEIPERDWRASIRRSFPGDRRSIFFDQLELAADDGAARLLLPAIERDVRRMLSERAGSHAIHVFADNVRNLLLQPPLSGRVLLALDPGYRTGCKVAVVDPTGKVLATDTIYPHVPQKQWQRSLATLADLVARYDVSLLVIGNGTASRETEKLAAELIGRDSRSDAARPENPLHYLMVNEAGASVYSASPLARLELPDLDVSLRSGVSLARRIQDPLAELVKIDPRSIGVGLYQHDVNQKQLQASLDDVVESVVNQVGVDVNTASPALLNHVSGIGPKLAQAIVTRRDDVGPFSDRRALRSVPGLGPKAFQQAAGFLRVRDGDEPLDAGAIHPESYKAARQVLKRSGITPTMPHAQRKSSLDQLLLRVGASELAADLGIGEPTLADICEQIVRPGRDPRDDLPAPILRSDVLSMDDLSVGLELQGTVRNVVDFGAFIDIGVKQDGLLHRSQIPAGTQLAVGDVITVQILSVEQERGRIGLAWANEAAATDQAG
jgi:uncharacterized protein